MKNCCFKTVDDVGDTRCIIDGYLCDFCDRIPITSDEVLEYYANIYIKAQDLRRRFPQRFKRAAMYHPVLALAGIFSSFHRFLEVII